jgi:hypothetical protein
MCQKIFEEVRKNEVIFVKSEYRSEMYILVLWERNGALNEKGEFFRTSLYEKILFVKMINLSTKL